MTDHSIAAGRCKICGGPSQFFAAVDASQHCNLQLPSISHPSSDTVTYSQCLSCEYIFTNYLDGWSKDELCDRIYNSDYVKFDPLYPRIRPEINARFVKGIIAEAWLGERAPAVLDYGAGSGLLSFILKPDLTVDNFDAMNPEFDILPDARYDVIFCAEVVEHIPFPASFAKDWQALLNDGGVVVFSTKILPDDIDVQRGGWWYLGPRNGHVSLYSQKSLGILLGEAGLEYECLSEDWHLAINGDRAVLNLDVVRRLVDMQPKGFIEI